MRRRHWLWLALGVAVIVVAGMLPAVTARREPACVYVEPAVSVDPSTAAGRAHVDADLAAIAAEASSFGAAVALRPIESESIDAKAGAATAPQRAAAWCASTLEAEMARRHGLRVAQVRELKARTADERDVDHALADRASGSDATSSVVSRPSR